MTDPAPLDPLARLRTLTQARVGLGRCGTGLPTRPMLDFQLAHARARDAVHQPFDAAAMSKALAPQQTLLVRSRAADRLEYLRRPDLGRRMDPLDAELCRAGPYDLAIVVADGLSATAVHRHAPPLVNAICERLDGWSIAPIVLARLGRVALGDEVGERFGAGLVAVLIGERPGLSAPDSLGVYLTWAPRVGCNDSQRNCISNVRQGGLSYDDAAGRLVWLMNGARRLRMTGVGLKDGFDPQAALPGA